MTGIPLLKNKKVRAVTVHQSKNARFLFTFDADPVRPDFKIPLTCTAVAVCWLFVIVTGLDSKAIELIILV